MRLNRRDLRKIQYDFNSFSNRLLQADFQDYTDVLGKFLDFINSTPIISDYIADCGQCEWDLEDEVKQVQSSYGRMIFSTGNTDEEEVRNVYAVLQYIVEKSIEVQYGIGMGYSSSNKYQDKITFCGGFDNQGVFDKAGVTEEEVRAEVRKTYHELAPGGGYVAYPLVIQKEIMPWFLDECRKIQDDYE